MKLIPGPIAIPEENAKALSVSEFSECYLATAWAAIMAHWEKGAENERNHCSV